MSKGLALLVPVLARPHRVAPLLASIETSTPEPYRVVFIADPSDLEEQRAVHESGADLMLIDGGFASKVNAGVRATTEPLIFIGADDLDPRPGWFEAASAKLGDGVHVVGVNDLIQRREGRAGHATHFLMTREYAELPTIDGERGPLAECYDHSWVDNELIATATKRGAYAYAADAHVAHLHPMAGNAPDDATYERGRLRFRQDRRLYWRRSAMWT